MSQSFIDSLREKVTANDAQTYELVIPGTGGQLVGVYRPVSWDRFSEMMPAPGKKITVENAVKILAALLDRFESEEDGERTGQVPPDFKWRELAEALGAGEISSTADAIAFVFPNEIAIVQHSMMLIAIMSSAQGEAIKASLGE